MSSIVLILDIFYSTEIIFREFLFSAPSCREWNTLVEAPAEKRSGTYQKSCGADRSQPESISSISMEKESRISTGMQEMDRVLGGGLVTGSLLSLIHI